MSVLGTNRKLVCDFLLVTDILSRTVSKLSQIIVQILNKCVLSPSLGAEGQRTLFVLGPLESS